MNCFLLLCSHSPFSYFTLMLLFLFPFPTYWFHVGIPRSSSILFSNVFPLFLIPLFPTPFINGLFSYSISRYLIHSSLLLSVGAVSFRFPLLRHSGLALSKSEVRNIWRRASTAAGKAPSVWWQGYGVRSGQWHTEGGLGCSTPPPRNSEGPPKSCQTQSDCENY